MEIERESSCGSGHCCGSGNRERAPAGADTTAVVGTKREVLLRERSLLGQWGNRGGGGVGEGEGMEGKASCWSEHCCGSEEI